MVLRELVVLSLVMRLVVLDESGKSSAVRAAVAMAGWATGASCRGLSVGDDEVLLVRRRRRVSCGGCPHLVMTLMG